jgi:hypothetical protein
MEDTIAHALLPVFRTGSRFLEPVLNSYPSESLRVLLVILDAVAEPGARYISYISLYQQYS